MKQLTILGLFVVLSLALVACGSDAELTTAPESEAASAPFEEPAEESVQEAVAAKGGTDDEVVGDESANTLISNNEASTNVSAAAAEAEAGMAEQETAETESIAAAEAEMQQAKSIAEIVAEDPSLKTLAAGLDAAGMTDALAAEGEFTLFAPTDEAFNALPEGALEFWFADPKGALRDVLLFHVVEGVVTAEDIVDLDALPTLLGEDIVVFVDGAGLIFLNEDVQIIITDIEASNGVIHVIDAVLVTDAGLG